MTGTGGAARGSRRQRIGWALLVLVALVALQSAAFLGLPDRPPEGDLEAIGTTWEEVQAEAPAVADMLARNLRSLAIAYAGFGLFGLATAVRGFRTPERGTWLTSWIIPLTLGVIAVHFVISTGGALAAFYVAVALVAAIGVLAAVPGHRGGTS